jgi:hypothetical protein
MAWEWQRSSCAARPAAAQAAGQPASQQPAVARPRPAGSWLPPPLATAMTKPLVTVAARRLLLLCVLVGSSPVVYARRNTLPAQMRLPADELGRQQLLLQKGAAGPSSSCPCEPKTLCEPVTVQHEREVFGFTAGADYQQMDWDQVTTVAWSTDSQLVCEAHKHKARLVAAAPLTNITALGTNDEALQAWVGQVVAMVRSLHIDGVTFGELISPSAV